MEGMLNSLLGKATQVLVVILVSMAVNHHRKAGGTVCLSGKV